MTLPRPARPFFSSGPCARRPGWSPGVLANALTGRSHRSPEGRRRLGELVRLSREVAGIPDDWRVAITPGSDTGAIELALWALLGERGADMLVWDSFGAQWARDASAHLGLRDLRLLEAGAGRLPDNGCLDPDRDHVFVWNGTTSGVCIPGPEWLGPGGDGLAICDATSAIFCVPLPWWRLDVVTWSWQKGLGSEAAHGMIAISPRAADRFCRPPLRPLPKIFRLAEGGSLKEEIFRGDTINTPSMLCVEDCLDALRWAAGEGGLPALCARVRANAAVIAGWNSPWLRDVAWTPGIRSPSSPCFRLRPPAGELADGEQRRIIARACAFLEQEGIALDIAGHRDAPPGLRIWCGPTIVTGDLEALLPWIDLAVRRALSSS